MRNTHRVQHARYALASSLWARGEAPRPADQGTVIDLLADLRHYCKRHGFDYVQCDRIALDHFETECVIGEPEILTV